MRREQLCAVVVFLLVGLCLAVFEPFAPDDAFIHFRIARNWGSGLGPFYNLGDPVFASSSLLWTAVLSVLQRVLGAALFDVGLTILLAALASCTAYLVLSMSNRLPLALQVSVFGLILFAALTRMETMLALFLLALSYRYQLYGSPRRSLLLMTLGVFVRLEMLAFILVSFVFAIVREREKVAVVSRYALICGGLFVVYAAICFAYFETLIPQTVLAKGLVYQVPFPESLLRLLHGLFLGSALGRTSELMFLFGAFILAALLAVIATSGAMKSRINFERLTSYAYEWWCQTLFLAVLYITSGTLLFSWYLPLLITPALLAMLHRWQFNTIALRALTLVIVSPLLFYAAQTVVSGVSGKYHWYPGNPYDARTLELRAVGAYLAQRYAEEDGIQLVAPEIGGLGYEWPWNLVDSAGLVSSQPFEFHRREERGELVGSRSSGAVAALPAGLFAELSPDYAVGFRLFIEDSLLHYPGEQYEVHRLDAFPARCRESILGSNSFVFGELIIISKKGTFATSEYEAFRSEFFASLLRECSLH